MDLKNCYAVRLNYELRDKDVFNELMFPEECKDVLTRLCAIINKVEAHENNGGASLTSMRYYELDKVITEDDLKFWKLYVEELYDHNKLSSNEKNMLDLLGTSAFGGFNDLIESDDTPCSPIYRGHNFYHIKDGVRSEIKLT